MPLAPTLAGFVTEAALSVVAGPVAHVLTVSVEDYFHVGAFRGAVLRRHYDVLESRLERNVDRTLALLHAGSARATFFVLGCVAARHPGLVRGIHAAGHEIAAGPFWPGSLRLLARHAFREDVRRTRAELESLTGCAVRGFRAGSWLRRDDRWLLDLLADEGFDYDSSINPALPRFGGPRSWRTAFRHEHRGRTLWELPIPTVGLGPLRLAVGGGNYARQCPAPLMRLATRAWVARGRPLIGYFMPWELDAEQPRIGTVSWLNRVRHYRNLSRTEDRLRDAMARYEFVSAAEALGLAAAPARARGAGLAAADGAAAHVARGPRAVPVTIVVPLFEERANVAYLRRSLERLRAALDPDWAAGFVLVDDGSRDGTWDALEREFGALPGARLVRHAQNRGIAAALTTGIAAAPTEIVCSIDADCSYDPLTLRGMLPRIAAADLVTASPYHPDGAVVGVPRWRLALSRTLSRLYSAALGRRVHTVTSCCRVYRRGAALAVPLENAGFLGVAELLLRMELAGLRVVEHPATLESRLFGTSKLKTLRTVRAHAGLLLRLALGRARARAAADARESGDHEQLL